MMVATASVRLVAMTSFSPQSEAQAMAWFNAEERLRLQSITCMRRRRQFMVGHHLARCLAAELGGGEPALWQLWREPDGAPRLLAPEPHMPGLSVSLSHSGDWVGCAIAGTSTGGTIGLDVETGEGNHNLPGLAKFIFSVEEHETWQALPEAQKADAFYTLWTLKEARGKFAGGGLRFREARRETFSRADVPAQANAFTWGVSGLHVALFGGPGLQAHIGAPLQHACPEHWQLRASAHCGCST